jgi:hypothetical protein
MEYKPIFLSGIIGLFLFSLQRQLKMLAIFALTSYRILRAGTACNPDRF